MGETQKDKIEKLQADLDKVTKERDVAIDDRNSLHENTAALEQRLEVQLARVAELEAGAESAEPALPAGWYISRPREHDRSWHWYVVTEDGEVESGKTDTQIQATDRAQHVFYGGGGEGLSA